jgi:preprotein translocase subunit YajC
MDNFFHNINMLFLPSSNSHSYSLMFMLFMFLLVFYFMLFRPQQKKDKQHKQMIDSLLKGDEVITTSGLLGTIHRITKTGYVVLKLNDNTEVFIKRDFIMSSLPKGTIKSL